MKRNIRNHRFIYPVVTILLIVMMLLPAQSAWAVTEEETTGIRGNEIIADPVTSAADEMEDPEALLQGYLDQEVRKDTKTASSGLRIRSKAATVTRGSRLTGKDAIVYRYLRAQIEKIAAGEETSTVIEVPIAELGVPMSYTAADLSLPTLVDSSGQLTQAAQNEVVDKVAGDIRDVIYALVHDCPYDLYWYDKTAGVSVGIRRFDPPSSTLRLDPNATLVYYMAVSPYYGSEYQTNKTRTHAASAAAMMVGALVREHAAESDFQKLCSYRDYILNQVTYDSEAAAAADNNTAVYGDPWQVISVFDGNPNTNVVCEGYAKAFQYLADRSTFQDPTLEVDCVTGFMRSPVNSGNHMWNIVRIGGINYLADVTNSDNDMLGEGGGLFLTGAIGTPDIGYRVALGADEIRYTYDSVAHASFSNEELTLSDEAYPEMQKVQKPEPVVNPYASKIAAVKKAKVSKIKVSVKKRKYTVSWSKRKGVSGYQIQYNQKGKKTWKTISSGTTKLKVTKKLTKGKRYRFRVRPYTKIKGKKVAGTWRTSKYVKCK